MLSKRRRVDEEFRAFKAEWENNFGFVNHLGGPTCLIFTKSILVRNQKFAMGGLILGLGAETPAARVKGVWGLRPQRLKILHFFAKIAKF